MSEEATIGTALVTGGECGIGAACCRELGRAGFDLCVHYYRSREDAERVVAEVDAERAERGLPKSRSSVVMADLSKEEGAETVYQHLKESGRLEVLVNNAGMTIDAPLFSAKIEDFDRVVATNLRSAWYLTKRLGRLMIRNRSGRIVNISSVVGSTGNPTQSIYGMTKAAIDNFTKTAAMEFAEYNILVNSVAPGFIDTQMTRALSDEARQFIMSRVPLKRLGSPEEVAKMVRFLATDGSYCTGCVYHVNGGMYGG